MVSIREAIARAADSSRTTHAAPQAVDACRHFASLLVAAMHGAPQQQLMSYAWEGEPPLQPAIDAVVRGSFKHREPPAIRGSGYVVASLEAALWAFNKSTDFRSGALLAANLGDDADTTAAIYGQIAGAFYGDDGIPREWREVIYDRDGIIRSAERLTAARRYGQ